MCACLFVCLWVFICRAKVQETSFPPVVSNGKPSPVVLPQSAKNEQVCAKFAPKVDIKLWFSYIQEHNTTTAWQMGKQASVFQA